MKKVTLATLTVLALTGCAANKYHAQPGVHHYSGCHEVSIDAKNKTVTVVCPLEK